MLRKNYCWFWRFQFYVSIVNSFGVSEDRLITLVEIYWCKQTLSHRDSAMSLFEILPFLFLKLSTVFMQG